MLLKATLAKVTEGAIGESGKRLVWVGGISDTAKVPSALFDNLYFIHR